MNYFEWVDEQEFKNLPVMKFNLETDSFAVKNSLMKPEEKFRISMLIAGDNEG